MTPPKQHQHFAPSVLPTQERIAKGNIEFNGKRIYVRDCSKIQEHLNSGILTQQQYDACEQFRRYMLAYYTRHSGYRSIWLGERVDGVKGLSPELILSASDKYLKVLAAIPHEHMKIALRGVILFDLGYVELCSYIRTASFGKYRFGKNRMKDIIHQSANALVDALERVNNP